MKNSNSDDGTNGIIYNAVQTPETMQDIVTSLWICSWVVKPSI